MTDQTSARGAHSRRTIPMEYRVYYALIFVFALPFAGIGWFRDLARGRWSKLHHGIVGRALHEANVTTPKIFSSSF